jgi:hypothetical protein
MDNIMDLVYFCRNGNNEELRYSIRSAVKNLKFDKLWVVGGKPSWYSGPYIEVPQTGRKYQNVQDSANKIFYSPEISDPFILMNDDFYIIEPVDSPTNFNGGKLIDRAIMYDTLAPFSKYTEKLFDTHSFLLKCGIKEPLDFELHVPIVIHKSGFKKAFTSKFLWRSLYGNLQGVPSLGMDEDVKVYVDGPLLPKSYSIDDLKYPYLSGDDGSFSFLHENLLKDMFPEPSIYEDPDATPETSYYRVRDQAVVALNVVVPEPPTREQSALVKKRAARPRRNSPTSFDDLARVVESLENNISEIRKTTNSIKKDLSKVKKTLLKSDCLSKDNSRSHLGCCNDCNRGSNT